MTARTLTGKKVKCPCIGSCNYLKSKSEGKNKKFLEYWQNRISTKQPIGIFKHFRKKSQKRKKILSPTLSAAHSHNKLHFLHGMFLGCTLVENKTFWRDLPTSCCIFIFQFPFSSRFFYGKKGKSAAGATCTFTFFLSRNPS